MFNKYFIKYIIIIVIFWFFIIWFLKYIEIKNYNQKRNEIIKLLTWWISVYKNNLWYYPASLNDLQKENIINPLNLLLGKLDEDSIKYIVTGTWFILSK